MRTKAKPQPDLMWHWISSSFSNNQKFKFEKDGVGLPIPTSKSGGEE